jgi:CheY-like chemotaxis protein
MTHPRVLALVDDEDGIRAMLQAHFSKKDYKVVTAANGLEGVVLVSAHRPEILITDLYMPGADGVQMLRALQEASQADPDRDWFRSIAVVVISGVYAMEHPKVACARDLGAVVLPKPFGYRGVEGTRALDLAVQDAVDMVQVRTGDHPTLFDHPTVDDDDDTVSLG